MTNYPKGAYPPNPNSGRPANGDKTAWGGYCWSAGVPGTLLGRTSYVSKSAAGQTLSVQMRKELVPLWNLLFQIADQKYGYPTWANRNGENWGPWGYANRAVSGTSTPSGHSMALSVDINAPYNPYSTTWQSDMPPAMVADFSACGQYWGGYYSSRYDAMHYGYCFPPSSLAGHINKAKAILGQTPTPEPKPEPEPEDDDMAKVFYRVYRMSGVDYVAAPGHFRAITSPDDYHFLSSSGWIDVAHGEAQQVERNLLEYIRNEAAMGANAGGIGEIIN